MLPLKDNIPTDRLPVVTILLIAINLVVAFGFGHHGPLAAAVLLHGGTLQLVFSALILWIFGTTVEDSMARWRYALLCLLGGVVANRLQLALEPGSSAATVGATGAVAAVLGGYLMLYPRAKVVALVVVPFFFRLAELPAWLLAGAWFVVEALFAASTSGGGWAAYIAQLGGFLFGLLTVHRIVRLRKRTPPRRTRR